MNENVPSVSSINRIVRNKIAEKGPSVLNGSDHNHLNNPLTTISDLKDINMNNIIQRPSYSISGLLAMPQLAQVQNLHHVNGKRKHSVESTESTGKYESLHALTRNDGS
jgi:hypothetical protein